jgi:hypothetical protein
VNRPFNLERQSYVIGRMTGKPEVNFPIADQPHSRRYVHHRSAAKEAARELKSLGPAAHLIIGKQPQATVRADGDPA